MVSALQRIAVMPLLPAILSASLLACAASLPDLSGLSSQTDRMVTTIDGGFAGAASLLTEVDADQARNLRRSWRPTRDALHALAAYTEALTSVTAAGKSGKESAESVALALNGVLTVMAGSPLSAGITQALAQLHSIVAAVRARQTLEEAVEAAQPATERIATLIVEDLDTVSWLARTTGLELERQHVARFRPLVNYYASLHREDERVLETLTLFLEYRRSPAEAIAPLVRRDTVLADISTKRAVTAKDIESRQQYWTAMSWTLQEESRRYEQAYAACTDRLLSIRRTTANTEELLGHAREAVKAWSRAHAKLHEALEARRPADILELAVAVRSLDRALRPGGQP